jgi:hypothetical protein
MTLEFHTGEFDSPTELVSHLFHCGCELSDIRMKQAPNGRWRGSGKRVVKKERGKR